MKIALFFICLSIAFSLSINAQEQKKQNTSILFGDLYLGLSSNLKSNTALLGGVSLNYQINKNLLTARYTENIYFDSYVYEDNMFIFPFILDKAINKELALLYGLRWVFNKTSLSVSGGISTNTHVFKVVEKSSNQLKKIKESDIGFPFEVNFKLFKGRKKPFKILGIIPVGDPTALGSSFGLKIIGNISKHSYIGAGIAYGFGVHKQY